MSKLAVAGRSGVQNHVTIAFPIKSPSDAKSLADKLPPLMPALLEATEAAGTVHYSRFVVLSDKTLLFLADIDGEVAEFLGHLAKQAGPVFDAILGCLESPPPAPVADNADAFIQWTRAHALDPVAVYTSNPTATVREIKSQAAAAGVTGASEQLPFLVIMPLKGKVAELALEQVVFRVAGSTLVNGSDTVGTLHFAHFVPLEDSKLGFFTVYDGPFDKYIQDFAEKLGPIFDLLFKFVIDPPPTPSAKNADALAEWVAARDLQPIGFYKAYPGLTVQDVNALLPG
ncbi:hypothetical protein [Candidatus Accumulibacter sp. ACC003]|uniref:hypothetical protein n=1 Tax=Candidatus Accumulibacter sp. ACC003 TaxID=2823334 RepID=UPI0025BFC85B|nr:hypothetical protein [Candidatus Accumulibacter sp. ACC003]